MMRRREKIWLSSLALVLLVVAGGAWHYNRQARIAELFEAISYGDYEEVREWVDRAKDPNISYEEVSLLTRVLETNDKELILYILEAGADPNVSGGFILSPTEYAAMHNSMEVLQACLDKGGVLDPNFAAMGFSALGERMNSHPEDKRVARFLLEQGADPDMMAFGAWPIIIEAVESADVELVRMLLGYGADVTALGAMHHWYEFHDYPKIKVLWTPIDEDYRQEHHKEMWMALYSDQVQVNSVVSWTALHHAAALMHPEMLRLLIENGADPTVQDGRHNTPLSLIQKKKLRYIGYFPIEYRETIKYTDTLSLEEAKLYVHSLEDEKAKKRIMQWIDMRETIEYLESIEAELGN